MSQIRMFLKATLELQAEGDLHECAREFLLLA